MNQRAARAAVLVLVLVLVAGLGVTGCGGGARQSGLAWSAAPLVFVPRDLPRDRVLIARIRNRSHQTLRLIASAVHVRDARGRTLQSSAGFTASYAHGLYGAFQQPSAEPLRELYRLGRIVSLDPGASSPVFAAWRQPSGAHTPVSLDYGQGRLQIPAATQTTAP